MLYSFLRWLVKIIFIPLGLKSKGVHNIPSEGPIIVAANHVSIWDPVVVAIIMNRPVKFMAKAELFNYKVLGKLLEKVYVFPVKRGAADRHAIKQAIAILNEGEVLGIFPEGTRNKSGDEIKAQAGAAMIALKAGAPILPVACVGTNRIFPLGWFRPLEVRIGEPLGLEEFHNQKVNSALLAEVSDLITREINFLLQEEAGINKYYENI